MNFIETLVKNRSIHSNDTLEGIVRIEGGNSAQTINKISLTLVIKPIAERVVSCINEGSSFSI